MNHTDALEYFENRRKIDRRQMPLGRRLDDASDAGKIRACEEIFALMDGATWVAGTLDDIADILARYANLKVSPPQ